MAKGAFKRVMLAKLAELSTAELEALRNDLSNQIAVRGSEALTSIVPEGALQRKLQEVAAGTPGQKGDAIKGAVRNAALYGGGGALALGAIQGAQAAPHGFVMGAVPSAISGYLGSKNDRRQQEIERILREQNSTPNINVDNLGTTP